MQKLVFRVITDQTWSRYPTWAPGVAGTVQTTELVIASQHRHSLQSASSTTAAHSHHSRVNRSQHCQQTKETVENEQVQGTERWSEERHPVPDEPGRSSETSSSLQDQQDQPGLQDKGRVVNQIVNSLEGAISSPDYGARNAVMTTLL